MADIWEDYLVEKSDIDSLLEEMISLYNSHDMLKHHEYNNIGMVNIQITFLDKSDNIIKSFPIGYDIDSSNPYNSFHGNVLELIEISSLSNLKEIEGIIKNIARDKVKKKLKQTQEK